MSTNDRVFETEADLVAWEAKFETKADQYIAELIAWEAKMERHRAEVRRLAALVAADPSDELLYELKSHVQEWATYRRITEPIGA